MQEAGGARSHAPVGAIKPQAVCLLPPSLHLRKMGKKRGCTASQPLLLHGREARLGRGAAGCSQQPFPPLLALSPIETGPSRTGTPGILPPAAGAPGWLVHARTPAPRVARVPHCQHCQPQPRLLPHDRSTSQSKQPSGSPAHPAFPLQPPHWPSRRLGSGGREGVNPLIIPAGEQLDPGPMAPTGMPVLHLTHPGIGTTQGSRSAAGVCWGLLRPAGSQASSVRSSG